MAGLAGPTLYHTGSTQPSTPSPPLPASPALAPRAPSSPRPPSWWRPRLRPARRPPPRSGSLGLQGVQGLGGQGSGGVQGLGVQRCRVVAVAEGLRGWGGVGYRIKTRTAARGHGQARMHAQSRAPSEAGVGLGRRCRHPDPAALTDWHSRCRTRRRTRTDEMSALAARNLPMACWADCGQAGGKGGRRRSAKRVRDIVFVLLTRPRRAKPLHGREGAQKATQPNGSSCASRAPRPCMHAHRGGPPPPLSPDLLAPLWAAPPPPHPQVLERSAQRRHLALAGVLVQHLGGGAGGGVAGGTGPRHGR